MPPRPTGPSFRFQFVVPGGKAAERALVLGWADGREAIDRDTEIAVEIFCEHLGEALDLVRLARTVQARTRRVVPPRVAKSRRPSETTFAWLPWDRRQCADVE